MFMYVLKKKLLTNTQLTIVSCGRSFENNSSCLADQHSVRSELDERRRDSSAK